jgi:hypothetical protein
MLAGLWMTEVDGAKDKAEWKLWSDENNGLLSSVFCARYARDIAAVVMLLLRTLMLLWKYSRTKEECEYKINVLKALCNFLSLSLNMIRTSKIWVLW